MLATAPVRLASPSAGVIRIRLANAARRNAISIATASALTALFEGLAEEEAIRLVILEGEGEDFCAGADLSDECGAGPHANVATLGAMFLSLMRLPQVTLALVRGHAIGAGLGLVAACDVAIGAPGCRLGCPEVRVGLIPAVIGPYIVRAVGTRSAARLMASGMLVEGDEALRLGLLAALVEDEPALEAAAGRWIDAMQGAAPGAARQAKAICAMIERRQIDEALVAQTVGLTVARMAGDEAKEGLRAFRQKRPPSWAATRAP